MLNNIVWIKPLYEMQKELDARIVEEKALEGQDLIDKKILALQGELGEFANEIPELFKYWSNKKNNYRKALEEYCDCLHLILSIGNDLGIQYEEEVFEEEYFATWNDVKLFNITYCQACEVMLNIEYGRSREAIENHYLMLFKMFLNIGYRCGFSWEEIEQSYLDKNIVNHERQNNGY